MKARRSPFVKPVDLSNRKTDLLIPNKKGRRNFPSGYDRSIAMQRKDNVPKVPKSSLVTLRGPGILLADFAGMFTPNHLNHLVQFLQKV